MRGIDDATGACAHLLLNQCLLCACSVAWLRLQRDGRVVRRGIIRHVVLVVDLSRAMDEKDLAPSRLQCTLSLLDAFLAEFFDQNPISQLGIVVTRDAVATRLTELSGTAVLRPAGGT